MFLDFLKNARDNLKETPENSFLENLILVN